MKNLLYIIHEFAPGLGGAGLAAYDIVKILSKKFNVVVLTVSMNGVKGTTRDKNITIIRFSLPFLTKFQDATYLSMLVFLIKSFFYGIYCIKKYNIDRIHGDFLFPSGFIGLLLGKIFKIKNSATIIGGDIYPSTNRKIYKNKLYKFLIKFVLKYSDYIVSTSNALKNLSKTFYDRKDIVILPLGIYKKNITIKKNQKDKTILCSLARLEKIKGIDLVLKAISIMKHQNIEYHIMGDGKEKDFLKKLSKKLSINEKVYFHGYVYGKQKDKILSKCDIFVLPSYHEGFGIVFLEAMEYGLPIITTNSGGQTDFIINGRNGLLLDDRNPQKLANIIDKLIEDKSLYESIREANLNDIKKYYWSSLESKYIDFFTKTTQKS